MNVTQEKFEEVLDITGSSLFPERIVREWEARKGTNATTILWHSLPTPDEFTAQMKQGFIAPANFSRARCGKDLATAEMPKRTPKPASQPRLCATCFPIPSQAAVSEIQSIIQKVQKH